ncbi:cytochrome P450 [Xylariaceae sp. FL1272]|nr:cytochrome P450 [Xylariaceae sp. FL1272]
MSFLHLQSVTDVATVGLVLGAVYFVGSAIYNLFFHPLSKYPGPLLNRISYLPRVYQLLSGQLGLRMVDFHKKYGPVVRLTPTELAFSSPEAWDDIYGHKKAGEEEFPKYELFYRVQKYLPTAIINAGRDEHILIRRQLSHGFSDRAMREQEPIIKGYVDLLIQRLRENIDGSPTAPHNMTEWYNWTTFDIIGDLGFGGAGGFGCLEHRNYHPWVRLITDNMRQSATMQALASIGLREVVQWIGKLPLAAGSKHRSYIKEKVMQRLELSGSISRPDFIESLIKKKDELNFDTGRIIMNSSLLVIAGSETTATLLCGATFLLATHPGVMQRLTDEVRGMFKTEAEINLISVGQLPYMLAVLNESLRLYPPVVIGLPRVVPTGGAIVGGKPVPQDTVVSVYQYAVNHDERYWTEPFKFAPERFLNDPKYKTDRLEAMQAFGTGPRNCLGKNLAYSEMRLIMARLIWNFDISLAEDSQNWIRRQGAYTSWIKPKLNVYLKPVARV